MTEGITNPSCSIDTSISEHGIDNEAAEEEHLDIIPSSDHLGLTLSWDDIRVTSQPAKPSMFALNGKEKQTICKDILKNVNGVLFPGTFLCIIGGSGSGKTTLLNSLTARNLENLMTSGIIRVNGQQCNTIDGTSSISHLSAYMQQDDIFPATMTVKEYLHFSAALRLGRDHSSNYKDQKVEEVIFQTGLTKCQDTLIGTPLGDRGISGGEKRRLAFANSSINDPMIFFCDEPTSGLDTFMAEEIVRMMKSMVTNGRSVVCTIHQPSSDIFSLFDQVLVMAEGRVAFMGPALEMNDYFKGIGYCCPITYNPVDYVIDILAIVPGQERDRRKRVKQICDMFRNSRYADDIKTELDELSKVDAFIMEMEETERTYSMDDRSDIVPPSINLNIKENDRYRVAWIIQLKLVMWRIMLEFKRNPRLIPARVMQLIVASLILGCVFWQQSYNQAGIANLNSALFLITIQASLNTAYAIVANFCQDYPLVIREHKDKMYRISAYYVAKVIIDIPTFCILTGFYIALVYWMIGFNNSATSFFMILTTGMLLTMCSIGIAHVSAALFKDQQQSLMMLSFIMFTSLIFSGQLLKESSILPIIKPLMYLSPFKHAYESMIIEQWNGIYDIDCEYISDNAIDTGNDTVTLSNTAMEDPSDWCYDNGLQIIHSYGYNSVDITENSLSLVSITLICELIGCYAMWKNSKK